MTALTGAFTYELFLDSSDDIEISWFEAVAFQGFDPNVTYKKLLEIAIARKKTVQMFMSDMQKIVLFYVRRGTSFNRDDFIQKSIDTKTATEIRELMKEYTIKQNLGSETGPESLSVARVVIVFAETVAAVYDSGIQPPIVQKTGLPSAFSFPSAAQLMSDSEWLKYKDLYLDAMVDFHKIINRKKLLGKDAKGGKKTDEAAPGVAADANDSTIRQYQLNIAEVARASDFAKKGLAKRRTRLVAMSAKFAAAYKAKHPEFVSSRIPIV